MNRNQLAWLRYILAWHHQLLFKEDTQVRGEGGHWECWPLDGTALLVQEVYVEKAGTSLPPGAARWPALLLHGGKKGDSLLPPSRTDTRLLMFCAQQK